MPTGKRRNSSHAADPAGGASAVSPGDLPDDAYLVRRAVDGYTDAFELLVARHTAQIYRVALRIVGDRGDAQDVTQETFLAAWQNLTRFRGDSAFTTWLYQIVTRRALNHATRGRTRHATNLLADIPDDLMVAGHTTGDDASQSAVDTVTAAVASLPFSQRIVIVLHHFEGLPYAEIAAVTGSTVPAVRSQLFRARRTLAESLKGGG